MMGDVLLMVQCIEGSFVEYKNLCNTNEREARAGNLGLAYVCNEEEADFRSIGGWAGPKKWIKFPCTWKEVVAWDTNGNLPDHIRGDWHFREIDKWMELLECPA